MVHAKNRMVYEKMTWFAKKWLGLGKEWHGLRNVHGLRNERWLNKFFMVCN